MIKKELKLSRMEKTLLHLDKFNRFKNQIEVPLALTQEGIAKAIRIARPKVSIIVRNLEEKDLVYEKVLHIQGRERSKKAYFLTDAGIMEARTLIKGLKESQYIDFADQAPQLRYFFGREDEIEEFRGWLNSDFYRVLVVSGIAGIGKTAYVAKAVEPYRESMHVFWYRFNEWTTLRSFLIRLGDFLSETGRESLSANLQAKEIIDINEVVIILADKLEYLNGLFIFDDYQKVKDKEEITHLFGALRQLLEQVEGTKIIIVGRDVPRFFYDERDVSIKKTVKELNLGGLDRESSLKLLEMKQISGNKGKRLYEFTGGHPLSLELICDTGSFETQEEVKRFMKDEIFSRLTPQERQILEIASVFRFPVYPTAYLAIAGGYPIKDTPEVIPLSLLGISPEKTDKQTEWIEHEVIDSLVNKSLLQVSEGVCDIHDLIREFLYSRLPEHTRKELHGKIAKYYLRETTVSSQTILEALYHFLMAEEYKKAAEIAVENGRKLIDYGYWQEILEIIEGIPSESIEPQHRPEILLLRGRIYEIQGKLDKALKDHRQSIRLFRKIRTKTGEATAYRKMGDLMWRQCRWNDAIERYRSALKLSHQTDDIKGVGEAHRGIGRVLWRKGEHDKALLLFEKSLECCRDITSIQMSAKIYTDIGCLLGEKGEHDKAIEYLNKSLSILEEMGDRYEMARAYINLSVVYHKKGKLKDAINWYERAIELGEEIGYVRGVAYGLTNAAEAYVSLGNLEKAREYCDRVLLIFEKLDEKLDEKFLIANTHMVYGIICTKRRDWVSSGEHFEKAIDISTTVDLQYVTAQVHFHYGQMLIRRKNKREAKKHFDESIKIWKKLGNNDMIETVRKEMNK